MKIEFTLNDSKVEIETEPTQNLADFLRTNFRLNSVNLGCSEGSCGSCLVLIDDQPRISCITPAFRIQGADVQTTEGLEHSTELHRIQVAMVEHGFIQCGFCSPALAMLILHWTKQNRPDPENLELFFGQICRCHSNFGLSNLLKSLLDDKKSESGK